jgi:hypothetical protein
MAEEELEYRVEYLDEADEATEVRCYSGDFCNSYSGS